MNTRLSKAAKIIIIFNIVITFIILGIHCYNTYRMQVSYEQIEQVAQEQNISKKAAIRILENDGVDLFINQEFTTYFGIFISASSLILLFLYIRNNSFFLGFIVALSTTLTSLVGGLLLFYIILSGKSEMAGLSGNRSIKDGWESFIHRRSETEQHQ